MDSRKVASFISYIGKCFNEIKTKVQLYMLLDMLKDLARDKSLNKDRHHMIFSMESESGVFEFLELIKDFFTPERAKTRAILGTLDNVSNEELYHLTLSKLEQEIKERPDDSQIVQNTVKLSILPDINIDTVSSQLLQQLEISEDDFERVYDLVKTKRNNTNNTEVELELEPDLADKFETLISIIKSQNRQRQLTARHQQATNNVEPIENTIQEEERQRENRFNELYRQGKYRLDVADGLFKSGQFSDALLTYRLATVSFISAYSIDYDHNFNNGYVCRINAAESIKFVNKCLKTLETTTSLSSSSILTVYYDTVRFFRALYLENQHFFIKRELWIIEAGLLARLYGTPEYNTEFDEVMKYNKLDEFVDIFVLIVDHLCGQINGSYEIDNRRRAELSSKMFLEFGDKIANSSTSELMTFYQRAIVAQKKYDNKLALGKIYDRFNEQWNKMYWLLYDDIVKTDLLKRTNEHHLVMHMEKRLNLRIGGEIKIHREIIEIFHRLTRDVDFSFTIDEYQENRKSVIDDSINRIMKCLHYVQIMTTHLEKLTVDVIAEYIRSITNIVYQIIKEIAEIVKMLVLQHDCGFKMYHRYTENFIDIYKRVLSRKYSPPHEFYLMVGKYYYTYADGLQKCGFHSDAIFSYKLAIKHLGQDDELVSRLSRCEILSNQIEELREQEYQKGIAQIRRNREILDAETRRIQEERNRQSQNTQP